MNGQVAAPNSPDMCATCTVQIAAAGQQRPRRPIFQAALPGHSSLTGWSPDSKQASLFPRSWTGWQIELFHSARATSEISAATMSRPDRATLHCPSTSAPSLSDATTTSMMLTSRHSRLRVPSRKERSRPEPRSQRFSQTNRFSRWQVHSMRVQGRRVMARMKWSFPCRSDASRSKIPTTANASPHCQASSR